MQIGLAFRGDLKDFAEQTHLRIARGARVAAEKQAARAKLALRQDVRKAGMGDRLANTWRANIYPKSPGVHTLNPAVYVFTKAPKIIDAHSEARVIRAKNATYLAIPTEATPRVSGRSGFRGGGRLASPEQVEAMFDQDLIFIKGRGQQILAFIDKTLRGRLKRWRGRRARGATASPPQALYRNFVLMFVLVRQVGMKKRLNTAEIFKELERGWNELFPREIADALNAGSN